MIGTFIDFARIEFSCPYCEKRYDDRNEKYLKRLNKIKRTYLKKRCVYCGKRFGIAVDMQGDIVGFNLQEKK